MLGVSRRPLARASKQNGEGCHAPAARYTGAELLTGAAATPTFEPGFTAQAPANADTLDV